jgi:hypothetical protein
VRGALDAEDRADMLVPFGAGQGTSGIEHLDQTGFIARSAVSLSGGVSVEGRVGLTDLLHPLVQKGLIFLDLGDQDGTCLGSPGEAFF